MNHRLHGISVRYDRDSRDNIEKELRRRMGAENSRLVSFRPVRRSIDARGSQVKLVYTVDFEVSGSDPLSLKGTTTPPELAPLQFDCGTATLNNPPVVVGAGPAGLLAAYVLATHGFAPLLLERGGNINERVRSLAEFKKTRSADPECNWLFGLGGAGTFSDGKLTTSIDHPMIGAFLRLLVDCGAPEQILIDARPHVGTDQLRHVINHLVSRIEDAGGKLLTNTRVTGLDVVDGSIRGVQSTAGHFETRAVILACGHSSRDTWSWLEQLGATITPKPFQMGIRVEHPQEWLDGVQYGRAAGHPALGAAEYRLTARPDGTPVFSFCMCPGGETIPAVNEAGHLSINGMSYHARDSRFASSGIVATLTPEVYGGTDLKSCLAFQRSVEKAAFEAGGSDYTAPAQRLVEFEAGKSEASALPDLSFLFGARPVALTSILPTFLSTPLRAALGEFHKRLRGYLHPEAVALAPESRASSPVRVVRDPVTREAEGIAGLFPVGEGAGYAGGITSAALDGVSSAGVIIERYRPEG